MNVTPGEELWRVLRIWARAAGLVTAFRCGREVQPSINPDRNPTSDEWVETVVERVRAADSQWRRALLTNSPAVSRGTHADVWLAAIVASGGLAEVDVLQEANRPGHLWIALNVGDDRALDQTVEDVRREAQWASAAGVEVRAVAGSVWQQGHDGPCEALADMTQARLETLFEKCERALASITAQVAQGGTTPRMAHWVKWSQRVNAEFDRRARALAERSA